MDILNSTQAPFRNPPLMLAATLFAGHPHLVPRQSTYALLINQNA